MLYHGSVNLFDKFDTEVKKRNTYNETNSLGIWLTNEVDSAKNFSIGVETYKEVSDTEFWEDGSPMAYMRDKIIKGYIYHVDLSDINLKVFESEENDIDSFDIFMTYRDKFCKYIGAEKGKRSWTSHFILENKEEANNDFVNELKALGYDGFIIKNTEYDAISNPIDQYCIFYSEKIIISTVVAIESIVSEDELMVLSNKALDNHHRLF